MAKRKWWQYLLDFLGPLSLINIPIDRKNGTGVFSDGMQQQLGSLVNSKTGAHLTGAQQEANAFSARMAEEEFARQEEFYLKYQSPQAMMRQGVNPFSLNGSAGGHSVSGGAPSSVSPSAPQSSNLFEIVQLLFGMQQQKRLNDSQIKLTDSEIALNDTAAQRNMAEVSERNINAETLKDMNLATIMEKLSQVDLNNSNIEFIAAKILNTNADTDLKVKQLSQIAAEIANTEADTDVKRTQISALMAQIAKDAKSLDVMKAQIALMATQAGVNRNQSALILQELDNLAQDYEFNEILKGFETLAAERELGEDNFYNSKLLPTVKRTVDSLLGWWSGSSTVELPQRKPNRIGYK